MKKKTYSGVQNMAPYLRTVSPVWQPIVRLPVLILLLSLAGIRSCPAQVIGGGETITVIPVGFAATEGTLVNDALVATFVDTSPSAADSYTATIQWGDGTTSAGTITAGRTGFQVRGSHTYTEEGVLVVAIIVSKPPLVAIGSETIPVADALLTATGMPFSLYSTQTGFIDALYHDLLGRAVDPAGRTIYHTIIGGGGTNTQAATVILSSFEYQTRVVQTVYQQFLHRPADALAISGFGSFLNSGGTDEQLIADIAGSPEYFQVRGGSTNDGFLDALYLDLLNRLVDPAARSGYDAAIARGVTRSQVAQSVTASVEYDQDQVIAFFHHLLHRQADVMAETFFVSLFQNHATDEQILSYISGSPEYSSRNQPIANPDLQFNGVVATFTDADPGGLASDMTATIDWGDGTASAGTIAGTGSGGFDVTGAHAYADGGPFTVTVTILDSGGSIVMVQSASDVVRIEPGDLNGDVVVDVRDLFLLLHIYLGFVTPTEAQLRAGDVRPRPGTNGRPYGDGRIEADDLNWIFRLFLGLEETP